MKRNVDVKIRLSENSRCVIVMTNLAFAPDGSQKNRNQYLDFRYEITDGVSMGIIKKVTG